MIKHKLFSLIPEARWVFIDQAGAAIAGLLGIKLMTSVLSAPEFGKLALANTLITLVGLNLFGPFGQGLARFWPISRANGNLKEFYRISERFAKCISLPVFLISISFAAILAIMRKFNPAIFILLSLSIGILIGRNGLMAIIFTAARRRRYSAIVNIANAILGPFIAAVLVIFIIPNIKIALAGYLLAAIFIVWLTRRFYSKITSETISPVSPVINTHLSKQILNYSLPFFIWGIFGWAHASCDRWALQAFCGPQTVGVFAVVSHLALYPLSFGSGFLAVLFSPIAFQKAGDLTRTEAINSAKKIFLAVTGIYVALAAALILLFAMFHYKLILLVSNIRFAKFSYLLPSLTFAWALFFLGQTLTAFGALLNRLEIYILPKVLSAIVAGAAVFHLVPKMGPAGVVWGLGIGNFIYVLTCGLSTLSVVNPAPRTKERGFMGAG